MFERYTNGAQYWVAEAEHERAFGMLTDHFGRAIFWNESFHTAEVPDGQQFLSRQINDFEKPLPECERFAGHLVLEDKC